MDQQLKDEAIQQLITEVKECKKCDLWKTRKKAVPGEGNINTSIIFIGEAPGYWEDAKGRPFVGSAGKLLDDMFGETGILRSEVYITNIVKCRPPENRDPHPNEVETCSPYLDRQLNIIRPRIIVTLGRHSTAYMLSKVGLKFRSMSESQGKIYEVNFWGLKDYIIVSYHPAAALYNVQLKREIKKALKLVKDAKDKLLM